jgi:predicted RNA binding protein YcfA (HicA-like mRNA interferase family)
MANKYETGARAAGGAARGAGGRRGADASSRERPPAARGEQPASWRELRVGLRRLGANPIRVRGSHETWRFDDGTTFVVVRSHLAAAVPVGILAELRRLRERRGARAEGVTPPRERARPRWSRPDSSRSERQIVMSKGTSGGSTGGGGKGGGGGGPKGGVSSDSNS